MERKNKEEASLAVVALTRGGRQLGKRIAASLGADFVYAPGRVRETFSRLWGRCDGIICIMAAGIVVRLVAPLLGDKRSDPAVVVMDERGGNVISLLSGHLGGGNALARRLAALTGGRAVITTASDVCGQTGVDLWARELGLVCDDHPALTRVMARLVNRGSLLVHSEYPLVECPSDFVMVDRAGRADLLICRRIDAQPNPGGVRLFPRNLVAGIGCNRGTVARRIGEALDATCEKHRLSRRAVAALATIDVKKDEPGLLAFARDAGYEVSFFHRDRLNAVEGVSTSRAVMRAVGARGVAEPAAILGAGYGKLLVRKEKWTDVTVAIAEAAWP